VSEAWLVRVTLAVEAKVVFALARACTVTVPGDGIAAGAVYVVV
jgi:hypothetical protein